MLPSLLIYFQIFLGKILNKIAKSEIAQYKDYLTLTKTLLIIIISFTFLYPNFQITSLFLIPIGFLLSYRLKNFYFFLGLSTFLTFFTPLPLLLSAFILLLTLIHSSLTPFKLKKILISTLFFILPFSLISIETFINQNPAIFFGLLVGGFLFQLRKGP